MAREARVSRHDACVDEGTDEQYEPGRVTAGVAHPRRAADPLALARIEFRQSVDPAFGHPVSSARVQHPHMVARNEPQCLARRVVGQAQDDHVGLVEVPAPHLRVLARLLRNLDEVHVLARGQPLPNLEPGRPRLPVDEYVRHCFESPWPSGSAASVPQFHDRSGGGADCARRLRVRLPIPPRTGHVAPQASIPERKGRREGAPNGADRSAAGHGRGAARAPPRRDDGLRASGPESVARLPAPLHPVPLDAAAVLHLGQEHRRDTVIPHTHPSDTGPPVERTAHAPTPPPARRD